MCTHLLASVTDVEEALVARDAGAHVIDLKDPSQGALGALHPDICAAVVQALDADVLISAALGDEPADFSEMGPHMAAAGVHLLKLGVHLDCAESVACLRSIIPELRDIGMHVAVVWLAESGIPEPVCLRNIAAVGAWGTMLDTSDKGDSRLSTLVSMERLRDFVRASGDLGLRVGLAGSLSASDVPQLAALMPDYLGFRGALCDAGRHGRVQAAKVRHLAACCAGLPVRKLA